MIFFFTYKSEQERMRTTKKNNLNDSKNIFIISSNYIET